jgi:uncharacterized repeat protein (TIGR03803 family)
VKEDAMSMPRFSFVVCRFPFPTLVLVLALVCILSSGVVRAQEKVIYSPSGTGDAGPFVTATDKEGNLYGGTLFGGTGCGSVFELSPQKSGWAEKDLYDFGCSPDGQEPWGVIRDQAGNLYGVTQYGGAHNRSGCISGCGTVFELSPDGNGGWSETVLYNFGETDAGAPIGDLVFDKAGNLYGVASKGGVANGGAVFELSPANGAWTETTIHIFNYSTGDGYYPNGNLVFDKSGSLYGTTYVGGEQQYGTVFKLTPSGGMWQETILRSFSYTTPDGNYPRGGVILDSAGNVYGTTNGGGRINECYGVGCGAVFELTPSGSGWVHKVLYQFRGSPDAGTPYFSLTMDAAGNLYGAAGGGLNSGFIYGAVFKLSHTSSGWTESVLYSFGGPPNDGSQPDSGVIFGKGGLLYGGTEYGGSAVCTQSSGNGCGVVYELKP